MRSGCSIRLDEGCCPYPPSTAGICLKSLEKAFLREIDNLKILVNPEVVYNPSDDTYLFLDYVELKGNSSILDMGTGTGILGIYFSQKAKIVVGVDVNPCAILYSSINAVLNKCTNFMPVYSDLFKRVEGVYDYILFNPPYLEEKPRDLVSLSWAGGRTIICRFLFEAKGRFRESIFLLVPENILETIEIQYRVVAEKSFFFEKLLLIEIKRLSEDPCRSP